jgi:GTP-binding protein Era
MTEGAPFFDGDDISDLNTKFFVGEIIREKFMNWHRKKFPTTAPYSFANTKKKKHW